MVTDPLDGESLLAESNSEWKGLPADTIMGHIHLHVSDLEKAEEFYIERSRFFGRQPLSSSPFYCYGRLPSSYCHQYVARCRCPGTEEKQRRFKLVYDRLSK